MTDDLAQLKRDELDEAARAAGVPDPESLPSKAAVIEAMPNPALVPEVAPEGPVEWEVCGTSTVAGHEPGETFTATFTPGQLESLVGGGAIKRVEPS